MGVSTNEEKFSIISYLTSIHIEYSQTYNYEKKKLQVLRSKIRLHTYVNAQINVLM